MRASKDVKAVPDDLPSGTAAAAPVLSETAQWVVFCLDSDRYALPLATVDRIVRATRVTPLPRAPGIVLGAIDVAGHVLPVFNIRRRFGLPERKIDPADYFLIARAGRRTVVLVIDAAQGVLESQATALTDAAGVAPGLEHIRGFVRLDDGLVLIHDLEHFLSSDEARTLDEAMHQQTLHAD